MTIAIFFGAVTIAHLIGYILLTYWTVRVKVSGDAKEGDVIDHAWDGDLKEINNPLPGWWVKLFYLMIVFGGGYLVLYPGVVKGVLGWSQVNQYQEQSKEVENRSNEYFSGYAKKSIEELAQNQEALDSGRRIFIQNCAVCHATDGGGIVGSYPNLSDKDWIWGGTPADIEKTIRDGRNPLMTAGGALITNPHNLSAEDKSKLKAVSAYIVSLSGHKVDATLAETGKELYGKSCVGCHGPEAKGNKLVGAPNLTDDVWLYAESGLSTEELSAFIEGQILNPPNNKMPAWKDILTPERIKVVSAYVYSLSQ